jgi:hypothetical protein
MKGFKPRTGIFLGGIGLAIGIVYYLLAPDFGQPRRQAAPSRHTLPDLVPAIVQRARGARREVWDLLTSLRAQDRASQNPELVGRVRFELDRVLSSSTAVNIRANGNRVLLSGDVSHAELDTILDAVRRVRGVWVINSRLNISDAA